MKSTGTDRELERLANEILCKNGYARDGRPFGDKRESVRYISTPQGGKSGYSRKRNII